MLRHFCILALTAAVSLGGTCRSPLSDVEITDPSLIRPDMTIRKSTNHLGSLSQRFDASFLDSNGNAVELKNGGVAVNGVSMSLTTSLLTDAPSYEIDTAARLSVALDSTYIFVTTLADGQTVNASVATQDKDLLEFTVPARHPRATDMTITWREGDDRYPMTLSLLTHIATDSTNRFESASITIPSPSSEQFTIPASFFTTTDSLFRVDMTLSTRTEGTVDNRFRSGGEIISRFSIDRRVIID